MRYAGIMVLAILLGIAGTMPAAAQHRSESLVDRLLSQVADEDVREARKPTVVLGDRNANQRNDDRPRGRTGRAEDADRGDRARTGKRTDGNSDRNARTERAERQDARTTTRGPARDRDYDRDDDYRRGEARERGNDRRGTYGKGAGQKAGNGPPFCRSGAGHPKHGKQWCIDKGWGLGNDGRVFDTRREDRRYPTRTNERTILDEVLGRRNN